MTERAALPFAARQLLLLWCGYFAAQVLLRFFTGGAVELDEAEQLVMTQQWCWGYEVQPPLYTWVLKFFFATFGLNLVAFALLKELLLAGIGLVTFRLVADMGGQVKTAAAAMLSFFLLPQFIWESQRDQTHSILATFLAAMTLWRFVRLAQAGSIKNFLWFGLCAGLGCLSKYNFPLFLGALLLAVLASAEYRRKLLVLRAGWSLIIFLAALAPHALWAQAHRATVLARAGEVQVQNASLIAATAGSFGSLLSAVVAFSGLVVVAYAVLFWRAPATESPSIDFEKHRRLVKNILLAGGALCLAMVVLGQARFKDRWMQPILFLTPIFLAMLVQQKLSGVRLRRLSWLCGGVAVVVFAVLAVWPFWAAATGHERYLNPAYDRLAAELRARGFNGGLVIAEDRKIGGNLRLAFPQSAVLGVNYPALDLPLTGACAVVWTPDRTNGIAPSALVSNVVWQLRGVNLAAVQPLNVVQIPREHTREKPVTFVFAVLPATAR